MKGLTQNPIFVPMEVPPEAIKELDRRMTKYRGLATYHGVAPGLFQVSISPEYGGVRISVDAVISTAKHVSASLVDRAFSQEEVDALVDALVSDMTSKLRDEIVQRLGLAGKYYDMGYDAGRRDAYNFANSRSLTS